MPVTQIFGLMACWYRSSSFWNAATGVLAVTAKTPSKIEVMPILFITLLPPMVDVNDCHLLSLK
jgi:hypothetical protein